MRSRIRKCPSCDRYTFQQSCSRCEVATQNTFPARFSPQDRFGKYRRMAYLESKEAEDGGSE
ncbi:MAG: RNA-protein complex protein Nop10 [Thermoplasmata archaeon]|nr:RNA-protein complex protein Nop10 [Thermoplasmata archaeon]